MFLIRIATAALGASLFLLASTDSQAAASTNPKITYPEPRPTPAWIDHSAIMAFTGERGVGNVSAIDSHQQGINIICMGTNAAGVGFAGGPYVWDGKDRIYNLFTDETVDEVAIRKKVDEAHSKGLKVMGELIRMWHPRMLCLDHPDWQELHAPDAKPISAEHLKDWPPVTGCWNGPFGEFFIQQSVQLAHRLKWDGYNLDGFGCWTHCFCPACQKAYRADFGKDVPTVKDPANSLSDPEYRKYLKWRLNRWTQFVDRWQKALKKENPEFASMPWISGPGRWFHWSYAPLAEGSDAAVRLVDAPILELFWDFAPDQGSNLVTSFTVRYYRGMTGDRPAFMLPYFCTQGQDPMIAPRAEREFRLLTCITNGTKPVQSSHQIAPGETFAPYSELIAKREPFVESATTMKWAAMLVSESSRLLYNIPGQGTTLSGAWGWIGSGVDTPDSKKNMPASERRMPIHMESSIGAFRATLEDHLPLDIITEQDVEDAKTLGQYKVLILANAACMSDKANANVRKFVENGGGLVATQESSHCDEFGTPRADFGLADLFKASYMGVEDHAGRWPDLSNQTYISIAPDPMTKDPVITDNMRWDNVHKDKDGNEVNYLDYIGMTANVKAQDGATILINQGKDPGAIALAKPADAAQTSPTAAVHPFLLTSTHGKGRVAYFAGDITQSYFLCPYPYQRKLITNAIRWASASPAPIRVTAPLCVQSSVYEQKKQNRTVVHLLNEVNTSANRALPIASSPTREEIIPIAGIKVSSLQPVQKAWLEPEHQALTIENKDGVAEITVPKLEMHAMVVLEK